MDEMKKRIQQVQVDLAAVLTTCLEQGQTPKSPIYLALGSDLKRYEIVERVLIQKSLAIVTSETITLTQQGIELAQKCQAIISKEERNVQAKA